MDTATPPQGARSRALIGVISGIALLGVAEGASALLPPRRSTVLAVGGFVVDTVPPWLKDLAIGLFGTNDKIVLGLTLVLGALGVAGVAGIIERTRRPYGSALLAVLGTLALAAAVTRSGAGSSAALSPLIGTAAAIAYLRVATRPATGRLDHGGASPGPGPSVDGARTGPGRRTLLVASVATAALGALGALASTLADAARRGIAESRAALRIPQPASTVALPPNIDPGIEGLSLFVTPNPDFYRIDTALQVPHVLAEEWSLRVHGMVERELTLTMDDLLARNLVERAITLACVSNEVGGSLVGNAVWIGHPIRELLAEAGPQREADMVLSTSEDGFTAGTPLSTLTDPGIDALLAVSMNGEPLPLEHGFPVRMVTPGLYGYVSATKWLVDLKVTRFDLDQAYWTPRGYAEEAPVKMSARVDTPAAGAKVPPGEVMIAGVAWAQPVGVERVEVRVDDGPWQEAELYDVPGDDTWRQWSWKWHARGSGDHQVYARVVNADGEEQATSTLPPAPDGATGIHTRLVRVA